MDELRRMLEREGGHDTLLQFLEVCPRIYSVVRYEAGEPAPGIGRVKTAVLAQKGYIGYPAVLFVYADGMGMDWEKIAITLHRGESDYREPTEKELGDIGMAPERCHPFPDFEKVCTLDRRRMINVDSLLVNQAPDFGFPVYSRGREIGSLYIPPRYYFEAMERITGDEKQEHWVPEDRVMGITDFTCRSL